MTAMLNSAPKKKAVKVGNLQAKFKQGIEDINNALIEREEEVNLILTALLCKQHCLLIGAPGTAKSLLAEVIRQWIDDCRSFTIHCCKDTTRNVAFGPIKLSAMQKDITERNLKGGAADCHLLIMEECFKAGPAVLDMFLLLMNERIYREGLISCDAPLKFILGVSNEWSPEGCETALSAFFDRFLLRKEVKEVSTEEGLRKLAGLPIIGEDDPHDRFPHMTETISLKELDTASDEALTLQFTKEAGEAYFNIRKELNKAGIYFGDRRFALSVSACQAYAWLKGSGVVEREHLEILSHILWKDPVEQAKKAGDIILRIANPIGIAVNEELIKANDVVVKETDPNDTCKKLRAIKTTLQKLGSDPRSVKGIAIVDGLLKDALNRVLAVDEPTK